jgi:two-component system, NarL family, sensor histidine kinase DesK
MLTPGRVIAGRIFFALGAGLLLALLPSTLAGPLHATKLAFLGTSGAFVVAWVWFWLRALGSEGPAAAIGVGTIAVLASLLSLLSPIPGDAVVFATLVAGAGLSTRRGVAAVVTISMLAGLIQVVHRAPSDHAFLTFLNDMFVGLVAVGGRLLVNSIRQLQDAREEIARLAVSEERLRFARDLHDLLGQNLAVVVLKSELVARELPPVVSADLRQEVTDVASVARQSLNDVREAAAGYRQLGLNAELASSRAALRAAGIGLAVEDELDGLPGVQEGVLAWAVRESVTNVVKHSHGTRCVVRLKREQDRAVMVVEDNGIGGARPGAGSGLKGIEERVSRVGGTFSAGSASGGKGFRLEVAVPLLET